MNDHEDRRREVSRQAGNQIAKRLHAAGRGPDDDNIAAWHSDTPFLLAMHEKVPSEFFHTTILAYLIAS